MRSVGLVAIVGTAALWSAGRAPGQCLHTWTQGLFANEAVSGYVEALAVWDDGSGEALYVGGGFTTAGGQVVNRIARWDGLNWSPLGSGCDNFVSSIVPFDDGSGPALFVGGFFATAGGIASRGIAKWTGSEWVGLGGIGGDLGGVYSLLVHDDGSGPKLYAGGYFMYIGGVLAPYVARWDGVAWSAVGTGGPSSTVEQLLEFDDGTGAKLYAGGAFAYGLKCWDGATWTIVGGGLGSGYSTHVYDLEVFHVDGAPALFVAGDFTQAGGQPGFNAIAAWTGTEWLSLGGGMSPPCYPPWVRQLVLFDEGAGPQLFVSGCFSAVGGLPIQYQALWTGTAWTALSNPVEGDLYTTITWDAGGGPVEYVGGEFTQIGPVVGSNLMRYSATGGWDPFDANNGLSGYSPNGDHYTAALALATFNTGSGESLYVAGDFAKAGNTNANCIARWNGSSWAALGTGLNAPAYALATHDAGSGLGLYVGGRFTTAGGVSASRVARWSGTGWAAVGAGLPGDVYALASHNDGSGSKLYAGGAFAGVQRWNGSAWSAVGSGLTDEVYALESGNVGQTALFAATAMNVWKWNGANWTAIGVQQNTYALEICDLGAGPRLYAGGQEYSGGPSHLASWDGTNWTPLQPPIDDTEYGGAVTALRVYDDGTGPKLFVGGYFLGAGGIYSTCLLRWDGALWTAMPGGGANNQVAALAPFADVNGPALYVGGFFSVAGGSAAAGLARYGCQPPVPGDLDGDYDVDFDDAQLFWGCLGGPGVGVGSACEPGDLDADADIDLRDYAQLQAVSGTRSGSAGRRRRCVPLRAARHAPE